MTKVTPKTIVGKGGLLRPKLPEPDHAVSYPPWTKEAPTVQKARAAVRAGKGPRRTTIKGGRWA